jgi:hypothetical protein
MSDDTGSVLGKTLRGMILPRYEDLSPEEIATHLEQVAALIREGYGVQVFVALQIPGGQTRVMHRVSGEPEAFARSTLGCARQLADRVASGLCESSECQIWSE